MSIRIIRKDSREWFVIEVKKALDRLDGERAALQEQHRVAAEIYARKLERLNTQAAQLRQKYESVQRWVERDLPKHDPLETP